MVSLSGASEDYLKAIYHIAHRGEAVTTGLLAAELGVASPSVTAMIKRLQEGELVDRTGRAGGAARRATPPAAGDVPQPDARHAVARGALRSRAAGARALRAARGAHRRRARAPHARPARRPHPPAGRP